ncbi:proteasome ATPase [Dermabacteraceae bacterium P13115]
MSEPMLTYRQMRDAIADYAARNDKLTEALRAAREQILELRAEMDKLSEAPNTFAIYLGPGEDDTALVLANGRKMRLRIDPELERAELRPGREVMLSESLVVVALSPQSRTGQVVSVVEQLPDGRLIVQLAADEQRLVEAGGGLAGLSINAGDSVLVDVKSALALELVAASEVSDLVLEKVPELSYDQIGGLGEQIDAIRDAVELPFLHQDVFREYGLRPPKGVLLYGPPGCGKTMIAKAVAHELAVRTAQRQGRDVSEVLASASFLNVKGPELLNKFVGESERAIRKVFASAREHADAGNPVIIFFDEMEALFRTRGSGLSSDMETTVVPQLLAEIDGVESLDNVIVIGASNREDMIDPAILRPGRLDVKIRVERPDRRGAREILALYLDANTPLRDPREELLDLLVEEIFREDEASAYVELLLSDGSSETLYYRHFVSGAMLRNVVDRAKKLAVKELLAGGEGGVSCAHALAAVRAEFRENEDLPSAAHPDEWARVSGRRGLRIKEIRPLRGLAERAQQVSEDES